MSSKNLKFSGHYLIVDGVTPFTSACFDKIKDFNTEHLDVTISKNEKETLSIEKVTKKIWEDRFISLYFNYGERYPYSPMVATFVAGDIQELNNPRTPEQIELDDQLFVLIDIKTQRIWLSNLRQRNTVFDWIKKKIGLEISIKAIINESEFINKIKSVQEISFAVIPDLFNSSEQDTLSNHLVQDIYGFGAEKARVQLLYNNKSVTDTIKKKFNELIGKKGEFQDITVIGRSDEGFDAVFNLEEVISKISIDVGSDSKSKLFDPNEVFEALINIIK
jgi:hypothetical protein